MLPLHARNRFECRTILRCDGRKTRVKGGNQLVHYILRRVEHHARANDVAVQPSLADEDAAALSLSPNPMSNAGRQIARARR